MVDIKTILGNLVKVATNEVSHANNGQCPDDLEGFAVRDPDCPACQAIMQAEALGERALPGMAALDFKQLPQGAVFSVVPPEMKGGENASE